MMNIVIVSGFAYPEDCPRAMRTTELIRGFLRKGHHVTLYVPDLPDGKERCFPFGNHLFEAVSLGKSVETGKKPSLWIVSKFRSLFLRFARYFLCFPEIQFIARLKKYVHIPENTDLLITVAVPHPIHWGMAQIKIPAKTVWIADCGDPFMCGKIKHPWYFSFMEKCWCRKCNYIVVPWTGAKEGYYPEFKSKIRIIPQSVTLSDFTLLKYDKTKNPVPTFVYAGIFYRDFRDPRPMLEWLCSLKQDFRFIVYSKNAKDVISPYIERLKGKLIVKQHIPRKELMAELCRADFLINYNWNNAVQLPSKLIDYGISGRPVIDIQKPFDPTQFCEFLNGDYTHQMHLPSAKNYDTDVVTQQILDLLKNGK